MRTTTFIQGVLRLFAHLSLATYGVTLLVFGLGYAIAAAFDPQGYSIDYFFVSPTFAVPVAAGLLFGYGFGWRLPRLASLLIPLPSLALVGYGLHVNHQEGLPWARILGRFFGTTCSGENCYSRFGGQAMVVAPLVAALAYVIGAEVGRRKRIVFGISTAPGQHRWRRRACVGLAVVAVFALSVLQKVVHGGNEVEFDWSATSGFQRASLTYLPESLYPPVSRWLKVLVAPIDRLIVLQTKPRIASEMRAIAWKDATGCVGPVTLFFLPVVLGLDHISTTSCVVVDPEITALMKAAENDDLAAVRQQIASGADVNARDQRGFPVLQYAIRRPASAEVVRALLSAGADVNARYTTGETALLNAVHSGTDEARSAEIVKVLISAGVDLNAKNSNGQTALTLATEIPRLEIVRLLQAAGAVP